MDNVSFNGNNDASRVSSGNGKKPEVFKDAIEKISCAVTRMYDAMQSVQTKIYERNDTAQTVAAIVRSLEEEFEQMDGKLGTAPDQRNYGVCSFDCQGMENSLLNQDILRNCFKEEDELELERHHFQQEHQNGDPTFPGNMLESCEGSLLMQKNTEECFSEQQGLTTQKQQETIENPQDMNSWGSLQGSEQGRFSKQEESSAHQGQNSGSSATHGCFCENRFPQTVLGGFSVQQKNGNQWMPIQQQKFGGCSCLPQAKCGGCSMTPGYYAGRPFLQNQFGMFPCQQVGYGGYPLMHRYYGGYPMNQGGYGDYPIQHGNGDNFLPKNFHYFQGSTAGNEWRGDSPVKVSLVTVPQETETKTQETKPKVCVQKMEASVQVKLDGDTCNISFVDSRTDAPMELKKAEASVQVSENSREGVPDTKETRNEASKPVEGKLAETGDQREDSLSRAKHPTKSLVISLPHCIASKRKLRPPDMYSSTLRRCTSRISIPNGSLSSAGGGCPTAQCSTIAWARPRPSGMAKPKPRHPASTSSLFGARSTTRIPPQFPHHQFSRTLIHKNSTASINAKKEDVTAGFSPPRTRSPSPSRYSLPFKPASAHHSPQKRKKHFDQMGKLLLRASQEGRMKDVRVLLKQGANPNFPNRRKWTPLHMASLNCHSDVVSLLLERGADVNAKNTYGFTALHMAAYNDHSGDCVSRLIYAGCDLDCGNYSGRRALHFAAEYGNEAAVRALLAAGANKNVRNDEGLSPVDVANSSVRRLLAPDSGHKRDRSRDRCL